MTDERTDERNARPRFGRGPRSKRQSDQIQCTINFFDALNARDIPGIRNLLSGRHIDRTYFGRYPIDREAILRMIRGFIEIFPDWDETIDEIIPTDENELVVRHTGRGTQDKPFLGRAAAGQQLAAPQIGIITFDDDNRILEYRTTFPFTSMFEETQVVGAEDVMELRAEQGGTKITRSARREILEAYRDGVISPRDALAYKGTAEPVNRCQALLESNMRRCQAEAEAGSIYCKLHRTRGFGPAEL